MLVGVLVRLLMCFSGRGLERLMGRRVERFMGWVDWCVIGMFDVGLKILAEVFITGLAVWGLLRAFVA